MKSVVGFPRIGPQRELKNYVEGYLEGKVKKEELEKAARDLRKYHWLLQKEYGIDLIPSNDFSFYDHFLDHAVMLGAVPAAYRILEDEIDCYLALAKGYQRDGIDLKALPMKKWFFTNYHYLVPTLTADTEFKLSSDKPFTEFKEAWHEGIKTKPVLLGALTFLKLARKTGVDIYNKHFWEKMLEVYIEILCHFNTAGADFVQIDEPVLVMDLEERDRRFLKEFYGALLKNKGKTRVILQTYFGDIRDVYQEIVSLDFDALGLDLVDGKLNLELISQYGFPEDKLLLAGIVNGRNVFRNNYQTSIDILQKLAHYVDKGRIVLSTSCSLLLVPYSLKYENELDEKVVPYLAFAEEKLQELSEIEEIFLSGDFSKHSFYLKNAELWNLVATDQSGEKEKEEENEYIRVPAWEERIKVQKEALQLPFLPTTTIGSFPQTPDVRAMRGRFKRGEVTKEEYESFIKAKIERVIKFQEEIGLDVLVHGEYERNDMVEFFGENLEGFVITKNGWVQSYGTRCVKPPIIFYDIKRKKKLTVDYIKYAQSLTSKPVKGILTGPVTILNWSFVREDMPPDRVAMQLAQVIKEEVLDLEKEGIKIIQIDEAALLEKLPLRKSEHKTYFDWAIKAFKAVCAGVKPQTQIHTHMCYSNFDDYLDEIARMDVDVITFEAAKSDFTLLDGIRESSLQAEVGPGIFDVHSPRIVPVEEMEKLITRMLEKIEKDRLWINPDCGLKTRKEEEVFPTLKNMVVAAREIRKKF
ncbi:methionine synthase (B12-independent) [Thermosyntropha lipolytica DSM 11003]|uniref:5-methyltetrahydropteroyltriglutamate--homocysteine S-methyltransferase n=1 Tax=Thermosyntropha lipolytica DSM 11003 TaxID=1123382 RepID=A0A1M5LWD2_9FIRM|nr:5-methyltetrahydropteroyltriglutamate--homocysteine S-methyltransferase [Thermosyntropha lipolytica]SHG69321.1 methionine synthase (B12-independent) [Thermosyntropha lipolytica DSM 11003]